MFAAVKLRVVLGVNIVLGHQLRSLAIFLSSAATAASKPGPTYRGGRAVCGSCCPLRRLSRRNGDVKYAAQYARRDNMTSHENNSSMTATRVAASGRPIWAVLPMKRHQRAINLISITCDILH